MYQSSTLILTHLDFNSSKDTFHDSGEKEDNSTSSKQDLLFPLEGPVLYMEGLIVFRIASLTFESVTNTGLPRARMLIRRKTGLTVVEELCLL